MVTIAITIKPALAELYYVQGWNISMWKSFPHRVYSLLAWRELHAP